ncbi:tRNA pseudouridine(55) synthase TruB [bacterium]|jgi:tRNA pseudouridine55 synthase|nr:tRNA pseudouridine(55) synthase TruB [bacterium]
MKIPNGALLVDKPKGISSFGAIEQIQRTLFEKYGIKKRDLPKMGHGGTLDPFATGLLAVCVGRAVKLARYFLGASKTYEGTMIFGQTTVPGDPTEAVTERTDRIPADIGAMRTLAGQMTQMIYEQIPPMHSAKKRDGKPLYELARAGIEVEREPKKCRLYSFEIQSYEPPTAKFSVRCSSGTYIRTLAQDFGRMQGSLGMLEDLRRTGLGSLGIQETLTIDQILDHSPEDWASLKCWIPFDRLLDSYEKADANDDEANALLQGRQNVLFNILKRVQRSETETPEAAESREARENCVVIYHREKLLAVARQMDGVWGLERVFTDHA